MGSDIYSVASVSQIPATSTSSTSGAAQRQGQEVKAMDRAAQDVRSVDDRTQTGMKAAGQTDTYEQVTDAVERINEMMQNGKQSLKFQLDDDSGRMVIRVMDAQTDEVIRQIPSEETLKFAEYVDGLVGLIFNKKA
ncbi:flagellar protein FlaG [Thiorhodococcus fuscus]|uniref:Flagellar protein FlaG n=1 Tax=Thiorhodococcus fuscus TaxID=527200 RepID=A0ABW4Y9G2_9GAMM